METLRWIGLALVVFAAAGALDWANSNWVAANVANRAARAAGWSAVVGTLGLVGFFGILECSPFLAIPEILGFSTGSFVAVRMRLRRARQC